MSGTIRTIPTHPNPIPTQPSKKQTQVNEGIGTAIGILTVGAFLVPIGLAGLAAVGMAKGITAVTRMGMRAYRKSQAQRAAQEAEIARRAEDITRSAEQFARESEEEIHSISAEAGLPQTLPPDPVLSRAADDFLAESERLSGQIDRFTAQQSQAFDMLRDSVQSEIAAHGASALSNTLAQQYRLVQTKWESQSRAAQETLETSLREMHEKSAAAIGDYERLLSEAAQVRQDRKAYRAKEQALAAHALKDTEHVLLQLARLPGTAVFGQASSLLFRQMYGEAADDFRRGDYAAAFAKAKNLLLRAWNLVYDVIRQSMRAELEVNRLSLRAACLAESMKNMSDMEYEIGGSVYAVNLNEYYPDGAAVAEKQIAALFAELDRKAPPTAEELRLLETRLQQLELSCASVYAETRKRLEASVRSLDFCGTVEAALESQGYRSTQSGFSEDGSLYANFENPTTGSRVTAVISDKNGAAEMSLYNYGVDGEEADPILQDTLLQVLSQYTGRQLACHGRGSNSAEREHSQIREMLKNRKFRQPRMKFLRRKERETAAQN